MVKKFMLKLHELELRDLHEYQNVNKSGNFLAQNSCNVICPGHKFKNANNRDLGKLHAHVSLT